MLEIELKYRIENREEFERKLVVAGAQFLETRDEADEYFNAPDRDFKATDEVFRLRCVGAACVLTYKGPKREGAVKTREEIEVSLADGGRDGAVRLIRALGYRPTATVAKRRAIYSLERDGFELHVCLDSLEGIGQFVEVEIVAEERELPKAERTVKAVAMELELTRPEPRAYLRMVLEARGSGA